MSGKAHQVRRAIATQDEELFSALNPASDDRMAT
jgi:hypothetical protein